MSEHNTAEQWQEVHPVLMAIAIPFHFGLGQPQHSASASRKLSSKYFLRRQPSNTSGSAAIGN